MQPRVRRTLPGARGKPWPKLTAVSTLSLLGSSARVTLPAHPSVPTLSGSQVCQMSMERKWDRGGIRVAYAVDDRHVPLIVKLFDWPHVGHERHLVIHLDKFLQGIPDNRPVVHVQRSLYGITVLK